MLNIRLEIAMTDRARRICTAIVIQPYKDFLSENDESYWCYLENYGIEVKVGKRSIEGQAITTAIEQKVSPSQMETLLLKIVLPVLGVECFKDIVADARDRGFKEGKNAIRETFACLMTPE